MKKIININLAGRVIPIEDSAYESLQRYIESLRRYFAGEEGRDEIINDIESRVAELMNDKVKKGSVAVTDADIEEIITSMGRVEDFQEADAAEAAHASAGGSQEPTAAASSTKFKGRLYRDADDKFLGGVCAGIANYMSWDPAIVRLLFAIITFGGFGMGILLYIVLWIVLPVKRLDQYTGKRFYRNPDDRILGGVAGGLAAYFNKEAWMIRLIFAAPLILNILFSVVNGLFFVWHRDVFPNVFFGSFTGMFIVTYIILWIILPEARTTYQKMEMRGEKVDVNRIRQNVQEGMSDVKNRMQSWGEEVKTSAQNLGNRAGEFASTQGRQFATEARPVAQGLGYAIAVIIKAFFIFIAGSIAFGLFVALIVLVFGGGTAMWPLKQSLMEFGLDGAAQKMLFWGTVIFFFLTPVIAFITWLIRRMMRVRSQRSYLGWIFGGLWVLGLFCLIGLVSSIAGDMRNYERLEQQIAVTQPAGGKVIVRVDQPVVRYGGDIWWTDNDSKGWDITEDSLILSNVKLKITKSNDSNYSVSVWKYSAGRTRNQAADRASKIGYSASMLDSSVILGSGYSIDENSKFRGQKVIVEVKVPVGKMIRFDESITQKLFPVNVRVRHNRSYNRNWENDWDRGWDEDHYFFDWKTGTDYIMTAEGQLEEFGKPKTEQDQESDNTSDYEYKKRTNDSIQTLIDQQKIKAEEEQRKLEELQRKVGLRMRALNTGLALKTKEVKKVSALRANDQLSAPMLSLLTGI